MKMRFVSTVVVCWLLTLCGPSAANVLPAPIFGHSMVLQCGKPVPVWGRGGAGEAVTVSFAGQQRKARVSDQGTWRVDLDAMPPSGAPRDLVVNAVTYTNVVVGEVWVCAGQSNMRWPLERCTDAGEDIAASNLPQVRLHDSFGRLYPHRRKYSLETLRDTTVENYYSTEGWRQCSPATSPTFSAVAFYFGRKIHTELKVPIGLIHNAIGGVPMETYIPRDAMSRDPVLKKLLPEWYKNPHYPEWCRTRGAYNLSAWLADPQGPAPHHSFEPGFLFESGMRPLVPLAVRGFLWYQGESNATVDGSGGPAVDPQVNRRKFMALIRSWREAWGEDALPFYYAQLPGLNRDWELFREMQDEVDREIPNTGMAVTIDVGHPTNVHPPNKEPVGGRLALLALRDTYGQKITAEGPRYRDYRLVGGRVIIEFDLADKGLRTSDGKALTGFVVAGEDRVFVVAVADIEGDSVIVSSPDVPAPVAVRYAWADDPDANLVNGAGLPAAPFRTDGWTIRTPQ